MREPNEVAERVIARTSSKQRVEYRDMNELVDEGYRLAAEVADLRNGTEMLSYGLAYQEMQEAIMELATERDALRAVTEQMLAIFDRELPERSIGRKVCDDARAALKDTP